MKSAISQWCQYQQVCISFQHPLGTGCCLKWMNHYELCTRWKVLQSFLCCFIHNLHRNKDIINIALQVTNILSIYQSPKPTRKGLSRRNCSNIQCVFQNANGNREIIKKVKSIMWSCSMMTIFFHQTR